MLGTFLAAIAVAISVLTYAAFIASFAVRAMLERGPINPWEWWPYLFATLALYVLSGFVWSILVPALFGGGLTMIAGWPGPYRRRALRLTLGSILSLGAIAILVVYGPAYQWQLSVQLAWLIVAVTAVLAVVLKTIELLRRSRTATG